MLAETLRNTSITIDASIDAQSNKNSMSQFYEQIFRLNGISQRVIPLFDVITSMKAHHFVVNSIITSQQKKDLLDIIDTCGNCVIERSLNKSNVSALEAEIRVISQETENQWTVGAGTSTVDLCASLISLSELMPNPQLANTLSDSIKKDSLSLPQSNQAVQTFVNGISQARKQIDSLHVDSQIETFLTKVRNQSATLSDIDDHVMKWIQENKLTKKLRIKF